MSSASKTFLLTGATGALGSLLLPRFLERGHTVLCLTRSSPDASPEERVRRIVGATDRISVVAGDICLPQCDVDVRALLERHPRIDAIMHCAASVDFTDAKAAQAQNVQGLQNVLELSEVLDIDEFHHVSTAYVAGSADQFSETDFFVGQHWRNPYERSKWLGEALIRAWFDGKPSRRFAIYRPSILVGCDDGSSPTFTGYYTFFAPIYGTAARVRALVAAGESLPPDVRVESDGVVHLPLAICASPTATLNVAPIDWAADSIASLTDYRADNGAYHIVHPNPPAVQWVIETSLRKLGISGVTVVSCQEEKRIIMESQSPLAGRLQRQVDRVLVHYDGYVNGEAVLTSDRLPAKGILRPREISEPFLGRLLEYAVARNWGMTP